jgi:hypothetical protein
MFSGFSSIPPTVLQSIWHHDNVLKTAPTGVIEVNDFSGKRRAA